MHAESTPDRLLRPLRQHLTRPQWQNLLALVVAVQVSRTLILRQLALFLATPISSASCYRRLERVLAWEQRETWKPLAKLWARAVLRCFAPKGGRIPLLIDWTAHRDRCFSLWVMLPVGGRAVPVAFWLSARNFGGTGCQRRFEDQALKELREWVPRRYRVVLIGDRGFRGADRMRCLQKLGFHFVLRVSAETKAYRRGRWVALQDQRPGLGQRWQRRQVRLGANDPVVVNLVAVRQPLLAPRPVLNEKGKPTGQVRTETTWFLATDLPLTVDVAAGYAWRMQIEQTFRDYKALLGLEQERTKQPWERLHALLWAMQIGMTLDLSLGCVGRGPEAVPPEVPEWPRDEGGTDAPPGVRPEYRSESETREGLHQFFVQVICGQMPFMEDLAALYAKSRRMQERPQVRDRRRTEPALRNRTRRKTAPCPA
jgi:hypothetical protein